MAVPKRGLGKGLDSLIVDKVGDNKKSMSYAVMLRALDRTLTDEDADKAVSSILSALEEKLGIKLR